MIGDKNGSEIKSVYIKDTTKIDAKQPNKIMDMDETISINVESIIQPMKNIPLPDKPGEGANLIDWKIYLDTLNEIKSFLENRNNKIESKTTKLEMKISKLKEKLKLTSANTDFMDHIQNMIIAKNEELKNNLKKMEILKSK